MQRSNSPLPGHDVRSNARGMPGGMLKFRIDRRIILFNADAIYGIRAASRSFTVYNVRQ